MKPTLASTRLASKRKSAKSLGSGGGGGDDRDDALGSRPKNPKVGASKTVASDTADSSAPATNPSPSSSASSPAPATNPSPSSSASSSAPATTRSPSASSSSVPATASGTATAAAVTDRAHAPVLVAVCATKGGVAKSTNVTMLVAAAIRAKQRVLVVDTDSQCSVTRMIAPDYVIRSAPKPEALKPGGGDDDGNSAPLSLTDWHDTTYDQLHPSVVAASANGSSSSSPSSPSASTSSSSPPPPVVAAAVASAATGVLTVSQRLDLEILNRRTDEHPPLRVSEYVWLVPGDPNLVRAAAEVLIDGSDWLRMVRLSAFRRIVLAAAKQCGATLVLVDMSPSTGVLNKVIATSCDACLPCAFADPVSLAAACMLYVDTFGPWLEWQQDAIRKDREATRGRHSGISTYYGWARYHARAPVLLSMLVANYRLESRGSASSDTSQNAEDADAGGVAAAADGKEGKIGKRDDDDDDDGNKSQSNRNVICRGDSRRMYDAALLLASDRVPAAVRLQLAAGRLMLTPMVPAMPDWFAGDVSFGLTRAMDMRDRPEFARVCDRFDRLLEQLVALGALVA